MGGEVGGAVVLGLSREGTRKVYLIGVGAGETRSRWDALEILILS